MSLHDKVLIRKKVIIETMNDEFKILRQFGIKHNRDAFCRIALVGKIAITSSVRSCSGGMVTYPQLAYSPFRRSHFHRSENALSKS